MRKIKKKKKPYMHTKKKKKVKKGKKDVPGRDVSQRTLKTDA